MYKVILESKGIESPGITRKQKSETVVAVKEIISKPNMTADDIPYQIYRSLKYAKNGMLFILECGREIEENLIDKVNHIINKKLYRVLHIHHEDELHQSVSMVHLYKWIKGHLGETMRFKLDDIANQEGSDAQIYTWKEINEQYIN